MKALAFLCLLFSLAPCSGLSPGRDTMLIRIERPKLSVDETNFFLPYSAWWIEDISGRFVKLLYVTHYDDSHSSISACDKPDYLNTLSYFMERLGCAAIPDGPEVPLGGCPDYVTPPDGVSGCSESNSQPVNIFTKTWGMTDQAGNPVTSGSFRIVYDAVTLLQDFGPKIDMVWEVTVALRPQGFDTTVYNPAITHIGGLENSQHTLNKIEVAYGGTTSLPDTAPIAAARPNIAPPAPTAARPVQSGFCGRGSLWAVFFVCSGNLFSKLRTRLRKENS